MTTITQLNNITPEELTSLILAGVRAELKEFKNLINPPQAEIEYITRQDVAGIFHVSMVTIDNWTRKGRLKAYRIGNRIRYKKAEIDQALKIKG
jgi:excisionase family DNA binding protein